MIFPARVNAGDEIRVIAPARQLSIVSQSVIDIATARLEKMGFMVSFGRHVTSQGLLSAPTKQRLFDLHEAFTDPNVRIILSAIGGFNSNEILEGINFDLIRKNPKFLIGYSDVTALQNAIYARTGLVTYSGPHFSSFGESEGFEYTEDYFMKIVKGEGPLELFASAQWSADKWYKNQNERKFIPNAGFKILQPGSTQGTIIGGNLCTLNLLQGTKYMPDLRDAILFLEDDELGLAHIGLLARNLASLIQQPGFDKVKAMVFGRFHPDSDIDDERLAEVLRSFPALSKLPIICGVDFGHTDPKITFPVGGRASIVATSNEIKLTLLDY